MSEIEVEVNKEEEILQIIWDFVQAKVADINREIRELTDKRTALYDVSMFIHDAKKARGYDA